MNGLRYLMGEIQERRFLLHEFVKRIQEPGQFTLFAEGVPHFIEDGRLTFNASPDTLYKRLTVAEFNERYLKQFLDIDPWSSIRVPLTPSNQPPKNYKIQEFLEYEYGSGYCSGNLLLGLETPTFPQKFIIVIRDTVPRKPMIRYILNNREWTYTDNFEVDDKELEKLLILSHPYARWQEDIKKARTRVNPGSEFSDLGASTYYRLESKTKYNVPTVIVDKETPRDRICPQVIVHGWSYGYFETLEDQEEAFNELKHYWFPGHTGRDEFHADDIDEIMGDLIEHFRRHPVVPYSPATAGTYFRKLIRGYYKKKKGFLNSVRETPERNENLRVMKSRYPPGSVMSVATETGIPNWTLYRMIKNKKVEYTINDEGFLFLGDQAIDKIRKLAQDKASRKAIIELALEKGKSAGATKKWLQRHRNSSQEQLLTEIRRWLDIKTNI